MRVLLIGAYGFIGSEIARVARQRGMTVVGLGRDIRVGARLLPDVEWVHGDLRDMTQPEAWFPLLENIDTIVNASGLLQDGEGGSVAAVQLDAIKALIVGLSVPVSGVSSKYRRREQIVARRASSWPARPMPTNS